ncbi:apiosidase-like domain-containing protein [Paenibacillus gansuensis]|uniref:DUF4038 domain-containing protein n=1 Tax=Paenibacillus gansuensis TaxID=306542 RepID=A0ABW5P9S3_9BACL
MQRLLVHESGRRLITEDGKPFFWLGDTAWELFHRLTLEDAEYYMKVRKAQGFNVLLAAALAEHDGIRTPNAYGELPLKDEDPKRPNARYFEHMDRVVRLAGAYGIYIGLLPTWGDKVLEPGDGPRIFHPVYQGQGTTEAYDRAYTYGLWLGKRYRDMPGIIWILGGDRDYHERNDPTGELKQLWREMARGLREGDGGTHLISFHVCVGSSIYFHQEDWLDFNLSGSYHFERDQATSYEYTRRDYALTPPKPTLEAEPRYEHHPVNWNPELGFFNEYDVRQSAYWSVFSGACGFTYGCHDVWQFWDERRLPICYSSIPWKEALHLPGANQLQLLKMLVQADDTGEVFRPCEPGVLVSTVEGGGYICGMRSGTRALFYTPKGSPVKIALPLLEADITEAMWIRPRDGFSRTADATGIKGSVYVPPTSGNEEDWVLELNLK